MKFGLAAAGSYQGMPSGMSYWREDRIGFSRCTRGKSARQRLKSRTGIMLLSGIAEAMP